MEFKCLTHRGESASGKPIRRRGLAIRAEVNYVSAEEAKQLIAEGYTVIDVRDKSQFDRAHIKSCFHVPLFIENKDNDIGIKIAILIQCFMETENLSIFISLY